MGFDTSSRASSSREVGVNGTEGIVSGRAS